MTNSKSYIGKNNYIRIRLSDDDKEAFKTAADKFKMSMSDYIRYCCLTNPPVLPNREKKEDDINERY